MIATRPAKAAPGSLELDDSQMLGPHAEFSRTRAVAGSDPDLGPSSARKDHACRLAIDRSDIDGEEIHARRPDELGDEPVGRRV